MHPASGTYPPMYQVSGPHVPSLSSCHTHIFKSHNSTLKTPHITVLIYYFLQECDNSVIKKHLPSTPTFSRSPYFSIWLPSSLLLYSMNQRQGLSRNASSVSFGHVEHCFLTVWTPKSLCQNLLKMTLLRR